MIDEGVDKALDQSEIHTITGCGVIGSNSILIPLSKRKNRF